MDISIINATKTNTTTGIRYGNEDAPKKMIEFVNLACPYCRQWFNESFDVLEEAVQSGRLLRIIKLFDKEKPSLQKGNVMHHHITTTDGERALKQIKAIFDAQDEWKQLDLAGIADYATETLGLTEQEDKAATKAIIDEANAAHIQFVPTVIIDDHIFDESISQEELSELVK
ncbi:MULTISPECIES: DsbA family protein [unclassified Enterococcus]|uniref:DsbA family protein n=1 Tax=unclassified Enterococcus TaxID=2608891 RepID=UPI001A939405|nr:MULTISPECIES: DsbA family protein [unclassified Enterococcus]MBO0461392.1 DsbA family protein [Enterococcus sp. DIV1298c]MBO1300849.1 DsbA family protein [Enterococcus sp. DIV1271a]